MALAGLTVAGQAQIDQKLIELDGTANKSNLGANAILGVSLALSKALANSAFLPLYSYLGGPEANIIPVPMMNILNGGKHAADSTDFQEFMIVPTGASTFSQALRMGCEVYQSLKKAIKFRNLNTNVGDEGGFAPSLPSNKDAIELILVAIDMAGYKAGQDCYIALDVAASSFHQKGKYVLEREGKTLSGTELVDYYIQLVSSYPIISIEDGLQEDDIFAWILLTNKLGGKIRVVGDDLYTTNIQRLEYGISQNATNAILIKPNQIGTLTETLACVNRAQEVHWATIISHRSGETEDTTIADLSVATRAGAIKTGAPCRSERVAKYNRLLKLEEELGANACYAGKGPFII
jgi:enolase